MASKKWHALWTPQNKKRLRVLEFFTRFLLLAIPLYLIMYSPLSLYFAEDLIANISEYALTISGKAVLRSEGVEYNGLAMPLLYVQGIEKGVGIARACTGYRSFIALAALIFAVPRIPNKKRLLGLIVFAPILFFTNIVRVVSTIWIGATFGLDWFELTHTFLWREGLIALILLMWVVWLLRVQNISMRSVWRRAKMNVTGFIQKI